MKTPALVVVPVAAIIGLVAAVAATPTLAVKQMPAAAQKAAVPAGPQMLSLTIVRIKPELVTEYQEFQKTETIPALKKGGVKSREAWLAGVFGEAFEYGFVTPIESFAQYDGDSTITKALGREGAAAYGAKNRRFVASSHTYAIQARPDLSYEPNPNATPKLALLSTVEVAQGRNADFDNLIKIEVLPVMKKAQVNGYLVSQVIYGGNANQYYSLVLYDTFADIGKGHPFVRVLGDEGAARLGQKSTGIVTRLERSILRYVPDLSFVVKPTSSN